jgi:hypothetical protein
MRIGPLDRIAQNHDKARVRKELRDEDEEEDDDEGQI